MVACEPLSSVIPFCRVEIKHAVQEDRPSCADNVLSLRYRLKWMLLPRRSGTPY